jgi:hypothetical protein
MHCPLLEIGVMLCTPLNYHEIPSRLNSSSDPRFVAMLLVDYEADWAHGARGGADYWARAEAMNKGEDDVSRLLLLRTPL